MDDTKTNHIRELFYAADAEFPNSSTEFIFQIVCDRFKATAGFEIDHGDVAEALAP